MGGREGVCDVVVGKSSGIEVVSCLSGVCCSLESGSVTEGSTDSGAGESFGSGSGASAGVTIALKSPSDVSVPLNIEMGYTSTGPLELSTLTAPALVRVYVRAHGSGGGRWCGRRHNAHTDGLVLGKVESSTVTPLQKVRCNLGVVFVELDGDCRTTEALGSTDQRAASAERVEQEVTGVCGVLDECLQ